MGFLAWVALVPALFAVKDKNPKQSFALGFLTGWAAFCGILYWIIPTFRAAQVSAVAGILSLAFLAGYVALYYGTFFALFLRFRSFSPFLHIILGSALWVSLEFLRNYIFTGFPLGLIGYSQWKYPDLIQISSLTGIYGVSATILFANLILFRSLAEKKIRMKESVCLLLVMFLSWAGARHGRAPHREYANFNFSILQGNIDQYKKWDPQYVADIQSVYGQMAAQLKKSTTENPSRIVIWPETSVPGWIPNEPKMLEWASGVVKRTGAYHLIGAVTQEQGRSYNSAFLFGPDGKIEGRYDKMHLVPFGEFVPFQKILGKWIPVLNDLGGFDAGQNPRILKTPDWPVGASICYESIFPEIARRQVLEGAAVLVNLTNDGWYLDTAAPEQHFAMNVFRAVENRIGLVRAANTGISGCIDPFGKIAQMTKLNQRTILDGFVSLRREETFYTKHGDIFAWACAAASLIGIGWTFKKRKSHENA